MSNVPAVGAKQIQFRDLYWLTRQWAMVSHMMKAANKPGADPRWAITARKNMDEYFDKVEALI